MPLGDCVVFFYWFKWVHTMNQHPTAGMTREEKIARCRQWLPEGKFLHEPGSRFKMSAKGKLSQPSEGAKANGVKNR